MSAACVYVRRAQVGGPSLLSVAVEVSSEAAPGDIMEFGIEISNTSSAQQMRTAIVDAAKAALAAIGRPVVGNEAVVVFGGIN